jgi:hypothetical protein
MNRFMMSNKIAFVTCPIFTLWTLESSANMHQFMMTYKVIFPSCLIFTLWTLEFVANVYRFMMSNKDIETYPNFFICDVVTSTLL